MNNKRFKTLLTFLQWFVAVLVLIVWVKVATAVAAAQLTQSGFEENLDYAQTTADIQSVGNLFERYKAPFNKGTVLAASGDFIQAEEELSRALEFAETAADACIVLVNLVLTIEARALSEEQNGNTLQAQQHLLRVEDYILGAPSDCVEGPLQEAASRVEERAPSRGEEEENPEEPGGQEDIVTPGEGEEEEIRDPDQEIDEGELAENLEKLQELKNQISTYVFDRLEQGDQGVPYHFNPNVDKPW